MSEIKMPRRTKMAMPGTILRPQRQRHSGHENERQQSAGIPVMAIPGVWHTRFAPLPNVKTNRFQPD